MHRDNTFGTPEEDAFRRDFTDQRAVLRHRRPFSIIDYVGGLEDIRAGVIRSIGDPNERFQEDPVRMLRAVVLARGSASRSIRRWSTAIANTGIAWRSASPARLIEEYYKMLRSGAAEKTFAALAEHRLLETDHAGTADAARRTRRCAGRARRARRYRQRSRRRRRRCTNPILLGTLLVPLGLMPTRERTTPVDVDATDDEHDEEDMPKVDTAARRGAAAAARARPSRSSRSACCRLRGATPSGSARCWPCSGGCRTWKRRRAPSAR